MSRLFRTILCLGLLWSLSTQAAVIASWNLKRFDVNSHDLAAVSKTISIFDLIAVQEVMDTSALPSLIQTLNSQTGQEWDYISSHPIGRGSYKEAYAFVYRTDRIRPQGGLGRAALYIDKGDVFAREPFSVVFETTDSKQAFVVGNIHVLYGKGVSDRLPEIRQLDDYAKWLDDTYGREIPKIIAGDFNLAPSQHFSELINLGYQNAIYNGATTLSTIEGRYANLYDNLFLSKNIQFKFVRAGIFKFPDYLRVSHSYSRSRISDHLPVFVELDLTGDKPMRN